jgi:DNA polymerase-3 subunit gamma/tau
MGQAMTEVETHPPKTRIETYIPLYRKYRPQSFADVVGQEAIVQTLGNAIRLNRVAHAYLFCGPRGTGKTSTARIFAKSLNCEQGPTVTPCLKCASCTGIALGNALDVIEFDAASNNGVGDARELIENCQYSSMNGRFKVYIVDEVHMLTPQAFNALLKTLEEPPANVIFIFATTEAHKVLPTIVSRCQRFDFNRITTADITERLDVIAKAEDITIDEDAVRLIARHSRGGLRDAVGLLDQVSVLGRGQVEHVVHRQDVAMFIGSLEEELLLSLSGSIAERRAADLLNTLSELANRGLEPLQLLKDLTQHFRSLLLLQAMGPQAKAEDMELAAEYVTALKGQIALFPQVEELPQILARLAGVERNVRHSAQPQLWLEVGLLELAYRHEIALVKDLSERVQSLEAALSGQSSRVQTAQVLPASRGAAQSQAISMQSAPTPRATVPSAPTMQQAIQPAAPVQVTASQPNPIQHSAALEQTQALQPETSPAAAPILSAGGSGISDAEYARFCASIRSISIRSLLQQQTFPLSLKDDALVIGVISEPNLATLKDPKRIIHVEKAAEDVFGRKIKIELIYDKNRPSAGAAATPVVSSPAAPQQRITSPLNQQPATQRSPSNGPNAAPPVLKSPALALPPVETGHPSPAVTQAVASSTLSQTSDQSNTPASRPPAMEAIRISAPIDFSAPPPKTANHGNQVSMVGLEPDPPFLSEANANNTGACDDAPPPMEDDAPPELYDSSSLNDDSVSQALNTHKAAETGGDRIEMPLDEALKESQKHAMQLLQGKIL